jgi:hypothetical protein
VFLRHCTVVIAVEMVFAQLRWKFPADNTLILEVRKRIGRGEILRRAYIFQREQLLRLPISRNNIVCATLQQKWRKFQRCRIPNTKSERKSGKQIIIIIIIKSTILTL